jgi:hypothetical protein
MELRKAVKVPVLIHLKHRDTSTLGPVLSIKITYSNINVHLRYLCKKCDFL